MFCFECGGKLKKVTSNMDQCPSCGFEHYSNPRVTVQIIVENKQGEILLLKRNRNPWKGLWNTPGGFVEKGESAETAAKRETEEETGIKPTNLNFIGSYPDTYIYQKKKIPILTLAFSAKVEKAKVLINQETSKYHFFKREDIPFKRIGVPSDILGLRDYFRKIDKKSK